MEPTLVREVMLRVDSRVVFWRVKAPVMDSREVEERVMMLWLFFTVRSPSIEVGPERSRVLSDDSGIRMDPDTVLQSARAVAWAAVLIVKVDWVHVEEEAAVTFVSYEI
jgi:hypothetical protein